MPLPSLLVRVAALLLLLASPVQAQHADRIWGRVFTRDGGSHEGFIHLRGSRGGASWTDFLRVSKVNPDQNYLDWREATAFGRPHLRTVELKGYRITWKEKHPAWSRTARSGIRFGHLAELAIDEEEKVRVVTRSHRGVGFEAGEEMSGDSVGEMSFVSARNLRGVVIDSGGSPIDVDGQDVVRIEFGPAPVRRVPATPRLYGTAEDRQGRTFTGFVTWNGDKVLESDRLEGLYEPGSPLFSGFGRTYRRIGFSEIRSMEPTQCGANVTLESGTLLELCSEDPPPVQITDPELGVVEVEWDALRILRLESSPGTPGYDAFDGGHPLLGTVVTAEGEEIEGRIRWDADEEWSWELLDGRSQGVAFSFEFANVVRIERDESRGAHVTLLDGRSFHLTRGNDVTEDNKGIFIFSVAADGAAGRQPAGEWSYVAWEDFREARFRHGDAGTDGS